MSFTEIVHYMGIVQQTTACGLPWGPGKGRWSDHMAQVTCERCRAVDVSRPKPVEDDPAMRERGRMEAQQRAVAAPFLHELAGTINRNALENGSDTPNFILATFLSDCLDAWNQATEAREAWHGRRDRIGGTEGKVERVLREKGNKVEPVQAERRDQREVDLAHLGRMTISALQAQLDGKRGLVRSDTTVQLLLEIVQASPACPKDLKGRKLAEREPWPSADAVTRVVDQVHRLRELLRWAFDVGELGIYEDMSRRSTDNLGGLVQSFLWVCRGCDQGIRSQSGDARPVDQYFPHASGCRYKAARDELDAAFPLGQSAEEAEQEAQAAIAALHKA